MKSFPHEVEYSAVRLNSYRVHQLLLAYTGLNADLTPTPQLPLSHGVCRLSEPCENRPELVATYVVHPF